MLKVKEVAKIVGVSVRTLHHYDQIGLLSVAKDHGSGYRLYTDEDLDRLEQVLFFRELGFELKKIKEILDDPQYDRSRALEMQHELLLKKKNRLDKIIGSLEETMKEVEGGKTTMNKKEKLEVFSSKDMEMYKEKYRAEVEEKYSKEVVDECNKKVDNYSKDQWEKVTGRGNEIFAEIAALMHLSYEDEKVQLLLATYQNYITESFYECTLEIFEGLGQMYVGDQRFTKNINKTQDGLAEFISKGIAHYCAKRK